MRKNEGKCKVTKAMLMPLAINSMVKVIEFGEEKYTPAKDKGWKNYKPEEVMDSLLRHAVCIINGEEIDPESGLPHAAHMMFNAAVYNELTVYYSSSGSSSPKSPLDSTGS